MLGVRGGLRKVREMVPSWWDRAGKENAGGVETGLGKGNWDS